jgi:hypothetical protein
MPPYLFDKVIQVEVILARYHNRILLPCKSIDFFYRDLINLVVALKMDGKKKKTVR